MDERIEGKVTFHRYRTALVRDVFFTAPRVCMRELETELARAAGVEKDNHTVYEVVQDTYSVGSPSTTYIMFHDMVVMFGRGIEIRSY